MVAQKTNDDAWCEGCFKLLSGDFYYHMLNTTWPELLVYIICSYVTAILFWGIVSYLALGSDLDGSERGMHDDFFAAVMFATENCITMGWGVVKSYGAGAFVCGAVQQLSGIALNVIIFAIVCTKFQHPKPDILFANKIVVAPRDGIPTLLIRLGNKRCNIIYHPDVRLSFLCPTRTREGEVYIKSMALSITMPNVIAGVFTISHPIDDSSPLKTHFGDDGKALVSKAHAICVTCIGRDAVYQDDLHCIKRYNLGTDLFLEYQFVSCSGRDKAGNPIIDLSYMHEIEPIKRPLPKKKKKKQKKESKDVHEPALESLQPIALLQLVLDEKPATIARDQAEFATLYPEGDPGNLHIFVGALRLHPDTAQQPLVRACCWSTGVEALCIEAGVAHETHFVDLRRKPAWFEQIFKEYGNNENPTAPAVLRVTHTGCEFMVDSDAVLKALRDWYPQVEEKMSSVTKEDAYPGSHTALMEGTVMPWFGFLMATPLSTVELWCDEEAKAARRTAIDNYCATLQPIEDHLKTHAFLSGGDGPGIEDLRYAGVIGMMIDIEDYLIQDWVPERAEKLPQLQLWCKKMREQPGLQVQFLCDRKDYFATFFDFFLGKYATKYQPMFPPALKARFEANGPVLKSAEEKAKEEKQKQEKEQAMQKAKEDKAKEEQTENEEKEKAERKQGEQAQRESEERSRRQKEQGEKCHAEYAEDSSDEGSSEDEGRRPGLDAGEFALCL